MAFDRRKIDLNKSVLYYLPEETVGQMSKAQSAVFSQITIQRLLTMSVSGFPFRPEGKSFLNYSLSCPIEHVETRTFHYSNIPAYLVGVALTQALSQDLFQFLSENLFAPLHIIDPVYTRCPDGYFYGASGMEMSVHDLSQVGLLLYNGGVYEGKRILSEEYVKAATGVRQMNREGGYGYFIWKYRDGFSINVRAVGQANGKNPVMIIIPCHRVIHKNGDITGFACGTDVKKYLLALEHPV